MMIDIPPLLAISASVVLLMSGCILYDTSEMVNGREDNYIHAAVNQYLNLLNLFIHIAQLLWSFGGDD